MFVFSLVVAPLLLAIPDRPREVPSDTWVGKTVYPRISPMYLDVGAEPSDGKVKGALLNLISYRVYAERFDHVQVKTREGVSGWLRKVDVVPQEDAVALFTQQLLTSPNDSNIYNRRAAAWRARGEYDAALKDANEALRINPNFALYNNRALIYQSKRDYDKAIADYAQAIQMNPNYSLAFVNRALMWYAKKDYDNAIADTTQAIQFDPKLPTSFRVRGISWHAKKEYDKAIADFTRSLELDAKAALTLADRGVSYAAMKEYAKAQEDLNAAIKIESNNVAALAAAALFLASCPEDKFRDGQRALTLARQAQQIERTNSQVLQALAAAYAEMGDFKQAIRWQEHVLQDPQIQKSDEARRRLELYRDSKPYRRE